MLVNVKNVKQIFVNLKATFQKAFTQTPSDWTKVAMVMPSTGKENDYSWLSRFPKMREWVGDKVIKSLASFNYTIRNKDWEATVEVDRNDIDDDQLMGYAIQAQAAGQSAAELCPPTLCLRWSATASRTCVMTASRSLIPITPSEGSLYRIKARKSCPPHRPVTARHVKPCAT